MRRKRMRVALLRSCVQSVLDPAINDAMIHRPFATEKRRGEAAADLCPTHNGKEEGVLARAISKLGDCAILTQTCNKCCTFEKLRADKG